MLCSFKYCCHLIHNTVCYVVPILLPFNTQYSMLCSSKYCCHLIHNTVCYVVPILLPQLYVHNVILNTGYTKSLFFCMHLKGWLCILTHSCPARHKWDLCKHGRPRSGTALIRVFTVCPKFRKFSNKWYN